MDRFARSGAASPVGNWTFVLIAVAVIFGLSATYLLTVYKAYSIPAEGMMPTLLKGDRILADMSDHVGRQGEVIIFRTRSGFAYVQRVAARGGDTIEMRNGVPVINGVAADQRPAGTMQMDPQFGPPTARRLSEQLPGERGRHVVLDDQVSPFDDMPAVQVPAGSLFVLGDNRDHSADSRVPVEMQGAGIVPISAVRGRVLFITYSTKDWFARSGTRINP